MSDQLERAGRVIAELRRKVAELSGSPDPIAIVGMACRFPDAPDCESFWKMIRAGRLAALRADRRAASPNPPSVLLEGVADFDPGFFDISPREATRMDPQQRLFLEVAWDALEDAGQTKDELAGSDTGTFVGITNHSDGYSLLQQSLGAVDAHSGAGTGHDVVAGRLAYWLDLRGPTAAVNSGCSSSLLAIHLACQALLAGDCRVAVAGGVNLVPGSAEQYLTDTGMLAPDGRCKTFDARADGFGRGEGCGAVVLKRLSHARADRDRVLAVIRATAVNQDGRTNGLTAPNGLAQQALLRRALAKSGLRSDDISYVETHGTGTALGDPIEVEAIAEVYGAASPGALPCALGAVKANVNHLEGAAGIAGIIKTVLALRERTIPPIAGLETVNEHFSLDGTRIVFPRAAMPWEANGKPRVATISSFGWSGLNAHAILEEAPADSVHAARDGRPALVAVSTADPRSLPERLLALADRLEALPDESLEDFAWTASRRRSHFEYRAAVLATGRPAMVAALRARARGDRPEAGSLAARYEAGENLELDELFATDAKLISLPPYPYRKRRFWVGDGAIPDRAAAAPSPVPETAAAPDDWFYEAGWERTDALGDAAPIVCDRWIFVSGGNALAGALEQLARDGGANATTIAGAKALDELLASVSAVDGRTAIVDLRALDARSEPIAEAPVQCVDAVARLHASVVSSGRRALLFVVTRGAQAPRPPGVPCDLAAAGVWGLVRCLRLEHPELWGGLIDLDPDASPGDTRALWDELRAGGAQTETALRGGDRFVARLHRAPPPSADRVTLRGDGWYVLTGAFGVVGRALARELADRGARHLVLVGRSSASTAAARTLRDELTARGVVVRLEHCDVGDAAQVDALWSRIRAERPVRGIIHAAGVADLADTRDSADLEASFRAKVAGTLALERASASEPLDAFVCFSSAAAILGDPTWPRRRSGYAAANAVMDAIVAQRRARGSAGLSINWGLLAGRDEAAVRPLIQAGLRSMPLELAFDALWRLMARGANAPGARMVAALDPSALLAVHRLHGRDAFLVALAPGAAVASEAATPIAGAVRGAGPVEREALVARTIAREVRDALQLSDEDRLDAERGFFDLGMDSLMTVALKSRLELVFGLPLTPTVTLEYPSVATLSAYVCAQLAAEAAPLKSSATNGAPSPGGPVRATRDDAEIALSLADERDIASALAAELRELDLELRG